MEEFRNITPQFLEPYDVLFINYDGKLLPTEHARRFGEQTEAAIYDFVAKGKDIVFYHSSIWVDPDWPDEWRKLLGGYCAMGQAWWSDPLFCGWLSADKELIWCEQGTDSGRN